MSGLFCKVLIIHLLETGFNPSLLRLLKQPQPHDVAIKANTVVDMGFVGNGAIIGLLRGYWLVANGPNKTPRTRGKVSMIGAKIMNCATAALVSCPAQAMTLHSGLRPSCFAIIG